MARDPTTAVTYANEAAYDSDSDGQGSSAKASSSGCSGVLLGFDDGPLTQVQADGSYIDEQTLDVSRIGGKPTFPLPESHLPPPTVTSCPACSSRMLLLIQIHAPLTDEQVHHGKIAGSYVYRDEFDRMLYLFACVRKDCTGVRCVRAARRNPSYAKQGKLRRQREAESDKKQAESESTQRSLNPFASSVATARSSTSVANSFAPTSGTSGLFGTSGGGIGSSIFGRATPSSLIASKVEQPKASPVVADDTGPVEQYATTWSTPTISASALCIPPHYLSTSTEKLGIKLSNVRNRQADLHKQMESLQILGSASKASNKINTEDSSSEGWSAEAYEVMRIVGVEEVFLAFQERLEMSDAAAQVVRYEFGGTPLPFSANSVPFKQLYCPSLPATSSAPHKRNDHTEPGAMRVYDATCVSVLACPHCGAARTFEFQLMPNLVNIVQTALRQKGVSDSNKSDAPLVRDAELGWATVWCFVCSADCLDNDIDNDAQDSMHWQGWREEIAMIELED